LGIQENEKTDHFLEYKKIDSTTFSVWLGIDSENSKYFYSDTKKWEDTFRELNKN